MDSYEAERSDNLSRRMRQAGHKKENSTIQSAMAAVLEDLLRKLSGGENIHVFGSFADGWGSCLIKLDGSIEDESDIDITWILRKKRLHIGTCSGASESKLKEHNDNTANYSDGHIYYKVNVTTPNIEVSEAPMLAAVDVIVALSCCKYPPIKILEPGYASNMSSSVLKRLKSEIDDPRCHAVAASPPEREGLCMRVSTTHLERIVMQNLTTIQGQFFIIIKYLVKKVINKRVSGLKTYVAKNLLFYMLDETPEEEWVSTNLVSLARESLQILAAMIESSAGEDVCMTHFFLQDADVYFRVKKVKHEPKSCILNTLEQVVVELPELLKEFERSLDFSEDGNVVHFHCFWFLLFYAELYFAAIDMLKLVNKSTVNSLHLSIRKNCFEVQNQLETLIERVNALPDCIRVSRECLRAMLYVRARRPLLPGEFKFCISRGIHIDPSQAGPSIEARRQVLLVLQETKVLGLEFTDNWEISKCALEFELSPVVLLLKLVFEGVPLSTDDLGQLISDSLPALMRFESEEYCRSRLSQMIRGYAKFMSFVQKLL